MIAYTTISTGTLTLALYTAAAALLLSFAFYGLTEWLRRPVDRVEARRAHRVAEAAVDHGEPTRVTVEATPIFDELAAGSASLDTLAAWLARDADAEWAALDEAVNGRSA